MERYKLFLCDQKDECAGAVTCGIHCFVTQNEAHAVPWIEYDEAQGKAFPPEDDKPKRCRDCKHLNYSREIGLGACDLKDVDALGRLEPCRTGTQTACSDFGEVGT